MKTRRLSVETLPDDGPATQYHRLPVDSTDFSSLHRFSDSLDAIDDKILVDA